MRRTAGHDGAMAIARKLLLAVCVLALVAPSSALAQGNGKRKPRPDRWSAVSVQLLAVNDFHGALEPPTGSGGRIGTVDAGGVEYLATHLRQLESQNRNTTIVSAGDLIGASPLLSALFHDEPTIEAMNDLGLDLNAVGNHEFDEGWQELIRMQQGGCHPTDGCFGGDGFEGAEFGFLAANVVNAQTGEPILAPYAIKRYQGERIGFIGMTLEGTPTIVSQSGIQGLQFLDEAETANRYARELRRRGVEAIVVLLHEGGTPALADPNGCPVSGPIVDIVNRTTDEVDLFITGHTHQAYACVIDGRWVTSASSNGRLITDIDLNISRRTGDISRVAVNNRVVTRDVSRDPFQTSLIARYQQLAAPIANRRIGSQTADITRAADNTGESALGNLIADAQLAATDGANEGGAVAALMNPGGVRADLTFASSPAGEGNGVITYGEAFTVQPFTNYLVTMSLTGADLLAVLKQQWCGQTSPRILSPAGLTYDIDQSVLADATTCSNAAANPATNVMIGGAPLNPSATYRITVNSFLADGGDNFTVLRNGTNRLVGAIDVDAFEDFLTAAGTVAPPAQDRIDLVP